MTAPTPRRPAFVWIVRLLALWGLGTLLITFTPLVQMWAGWLAGSWTDPKGDVLIVLGGSTSTNTVIGESSYWRSIYAVWAWRSDGFRSVVITGSPAISDPMRRFLVFEGVPAGSIQVEAASTTTRENAINTARVLAGATGRLVLLTSDYHMFRASRAFKKAGLRVVPRPIPDALKRGEYWTNRYGLFWELASETLKIAYYFARGWI